MRLGFLAPVGPTLGNVSTTGAAKASWRRARRDSGLASRWGAVLIGERMSTRRSRQRPSALRLRRSSFGGGCASFAAALALSCTLDKLDVVSQLPCTPGSARFECAPEPGADPNDVALGGGGAGGQDTGQVTGNSAAGGRTPGSEGQGGSTPLEPGNGGASGSGTQPAQVDVGPPVRVLDKLDVLFMIDNSISMLDKQNVLGLVNTNLITSLATPPCVPIADGAFRSSDDPCPAGQMRAFQPITDIHIGIITSSLGDAGANVACAEGDRVDMAHLVGLLPRGAATGVAPDGFLRWTAGADVGELTQNFQRLTRAVGEAGCGWEMSLESWYRFLIEPLPPAELERVACPGSDGLGTNCVQPATDAQGRVVLDAALLRQRELFLRPDSLVAIVMLTDENDCSIAPGPQSWFVVAIDDSRPMFRGSSMCESNPNHPCCYSCPLGSPPECGAIDPICSSAEVRNRLPRGADGANLRCFDQKRRFGADFLYPTQRYVNALKNRELCPSSLSLDAGECASPAELVANPLYASGQRSPDDVFLAGIVGVPWQALAASVDASGNALEGDVLRFKSAAELGPSDWARIVGEPRESPPIPPADSFMRESVTARPGIPSGNPINGREYDTTTFEPSVPDDLEYACIFPLPVARDCSLVDRDVDGCDCFEGAFDTPLCEAEPGVSSAGTTQYWAKAYPGLRQLDVLRGYGANSVVASICARKVSAAQAGDPDFAYRPALSALVERLQQRLRVR
jgi:hypothetical protein